MVKISAGIALYRWGAGGWEILLVHPGGPLWRNRDSHAWSIPKGELEPGEASLRGALREFREETGINPSGMPWWLGEFKVANGKRLRVWAVQGDSDPDAIRSNEFEMEWPPHSGRRQRFPEVDRAAWIPLSLAEGKLHKGQRLLVPSLLKMLE